MKLTIVRVIVIIVLLVLIIKFLLPLIGLIFNIVIGGVVLLLILCGFYAAKLIYKKRK